MVERPFRIREAKGSMPFFSIFAFFLYPVASAMFLPSLGTEIELGTSIFTATLPFSVFCLKG